MAQCTGLEPPIIESVKQGDTAIAGHLAPADWGPDSRLAVEYRENGNVPWEWLTAGNIQVDARYGSYRIELGKPVRSGSIRITHTRQQACGRSAQVAIADTARQETWLNWSGAIPIRDRDTSVAGTAGNSVTLIRALVTSPRSDTDPGTINRPPAEGQGKSAINRPPAQGENESKGATSRSPADNLLGLAQEVLKSVGEPDRGRSDAPGIAAPALDVAATIQRQARQLECYLGDIEQTMDVAPKDHSFQIVFKRDLEAGQCVIIFPIDKSGLEFAAAKQTTVVQPSWADWGRLQGTLYTGFTLGQSGDSDVKAAPYVSFLVDATIAGKLLNRQKVSAPERLGQLQNALDNALRELTSNAFDADARSRLQKELSKLRERIKKAEADQDAPTRLRKALSMGGFGLSLNGFAEGRITQAATGVTADATKLGTDQVQSLFWQAGLYLPMRTSGMDWRYKGSMYSFFAGPLFKYGAQWLSDGVVVSQTYVKQKDDRLANAGTIVAGKEDSTPQRAKEAQYFYGYGGRFGLMRYSLIGEQIRDRQLRHELVSYVDVTIGQNRAFRTPGRVENLPPGDAAVKTYRGSSVDPRLAFEGRVKLPGVPAFVGFDLNLNKDRPGDSVTDFRFILGLRLDVAQTVSRIFNTHGK